MTRRLLIRVSGVPAGELVDHGPTTSFRLLQSYRSTPSRPVLGQQFEDAPAKQWSIRTRIHPWFANLLPEGDLRTWLAEQLGVSAARDFDLLAAVGADLPGAVTAEELDLDEDLDEMTDIVEPTPHDDEGEVVGVRMSVAGFQLKLSMLLDGSKLTLPGKGLLGDHLVKFPARGFGVLPENELATMRWAAEAGIDVPEVSSVALSALALPRSLPVTSGAVAFVIRRFDRVGGKRIHIEDLNQAMGDWPHEKYKRASYESLALVMFNSTGSEDDVWEYVRRIVFIAAAGNEDAHKKNFSLRYANGRSARLSPAYDMVSTVQYDLVRKMGLSLNRSKQFADLDFRSFDRLARAVGAETASMRAFVLEASDRTLTALHDYEAAMPSAGRLRAHLNTVPLFSRSFY